MQEGVLLQVLRPFLPFLSTKPTREMEGVPIVQKARKKRLHAVMDDEKIEEHEVLLKPAALRRHNSMTGKTSDMNASEANISEREVDLLNISRRDSMMSVTMKEDIERSVSFRGDFSLLHVGRKLCAAVFVTLDVDQSSYVAKYLGVITNAVIVLAVLSYVASTNPQLRYIPTTCAFPVCNNDPNLCPGYMVCADAELPIVTAVENFTTYYFTAEYCLRFLTVSKETRSNDDHHAYYPISAFI